MIAGKNILKLFYFLFFTIGGVVWHLFIFNHLLVLIDDVFMIILLVLIICLAGGSLGYLLGCLPWFIFECFYEIKQDELKKVAEEI